MNIDFWPKNPKPNFRNGEMNVSSTITMNYEQITMNYANKNKPNTKPIQTRSEAEIPMGELLRILKPGTNSNPIYPELVEGSNPICQGCGISLTVSAEGLKLAENG